MTEPMTPSLLYFILGVAGFLITVCIGIISYFLRQVHKDSLASSKESKDNTGRLQMVEKMMEIIEEKTMSAVENLGEKTQIEIKHLTTEMINLTRNVSALNDSLQKVLINNRNNH